jgi:exodeoxyribonuclease V beta subunit
VTYRTLDTPAVLALPLTGVRLIEASAGTGKTYTIANLYLRHILAGRAVGEVLVVTFTIAATDELRGRIRARLFEALGLLEREGETKDDFLAELVAGIRAAGEQELAARRLRLAVRAMDEAAIYTIHGFCQRALTELAFRSGQPFEMEVTGDDAALWRQAVQDWWRRTGYPLAPARARLFRAALGDLEPFRALLAPLLGAQPQRLLPEPTETGGLDAILAGLDALVPAIEGLAAAWASDGERLKVLLLGSKGLGRSQKSPYRLDNLEPALVVLDDWFAAGDRLAVPGGFEVLTAGCLTGNALKKTDPALDDPFFARCDALWRDHQRLRRDLRVAALSEAAAFARRAVREAKQQAQRLSFDDLLTEMHAALEGEGGAALAEAVCRRFPVAMIDEFQDTDPIQYGIFRRLYLARPDGGLILIGDPKQAIYSFRGGDIFTYMQAKEDVGAEAIYTLTTNWRSTPAVVAAVNAVFTRRAADAFVYGEAIPFAPAQAAEKTHRHLLRDGAAQPALTLWTLPTERTAKGEDKALSKDAAARLTHAAVADAVARLLGEARAGRARVGERPLVPNDIAVLVRTAFEAAALRLALAERGVAAVAVERTGVLETEEAAALETLLEAVLTPRDRGLARLALASPLLGRDYGEIERLSRDELDWAAWVDDLLALHETWQRKGFMAMFQQMLRRLDLAGALSLGPLPERRLTNLLHLGELLQQASKAHAGMDALLGWYRQQRGESASEETILRLESDADLVQIVTIHGSKGLQYPVVFVPYLWGCRVRGGDGLLGFHRGREACLDAGSEAFEAHRRLAEQERLAEDVRLAYVALTRAEAALYLVWGRAGSKDGNAGQSALGYLLHPRQGAAELVEQLPDAFGGDPDLGPDLERLAAAAPESIVVAPLPEPAESPIRPPAEAAPELAPRPFGGRIATDWRISSFSALTRDVHSGPAIPRSPAAEDVAMRFPAGTQVGSYLHLLLERIDFQGDVRAQVLALSARVAPRFGIDHARWGADAAELLERVVQTPLDANGLRLAAIPAARRLSELEVDFATEPVSIPALNRLLARAAGEPLAPLEVEGFQGLVNGVVDLVVEHEGRYYIADYKSNYLGGAFADYAAERLRAVVYERRYDLQFLLYTLALHRYLGRRLPGYDYARHFGGVYCLFLRGMRPESGPRCGVFPIRPALDVLAELDEVVFRYAAEEAP